MIATALVDGARIRDKHPMHAPWLLLDTSAPTAVVCVVARDATSAHVVAEHVLRETKKHAEALLPAIDDVTARAGVSLAQVVGVGVGVGPGSFIGVRTGIATAKGIALARGLPLVGLSSLASLASTSAALLPDGAQVLVVIDARRGEFFVQRAHAQGGVVVEDGEPEACAPAAVVERAAQASHVVASTALWASPEIAWPASCARVVVDHVTAHGLLAAWQRAVGAGVVDALRTLVPRYARAPDAKLPGIDPSSQRARYEGSTP